MSFPSPVKTFHDDTHPSINPTLPHLSTKGKNIVISGGGSGIGPEIARSFANPGASSISIFGRTSHSLFRTKSTLETTYSYPATKIYTYVADITDRGTLGTTFQAIKSAVGSVDILIANAGYMPDIKPRRLVGRLRDQRSRRFQPHLLFRSCGVQKCIDHQHQHGSLAHAVCT